jgi:hypothetical protein
MARKAKNLIAQLRREGWKPGMDVRKTKTFEMISEACGCDSEGHAKDNAKTELHLGDDADGYTIRDLYENLVVNKSDGQPVGASFVNEFMDPRHPKTLMEAGGAIDAVDSSAFMGVTGQLLVTQVLAPYEKEEYMFRRMIPTYPSPLEQERWIGIAQPKDPSKSMLRVQEGEPFNSFGFGEQYVQTPITRKEGGIIGLTKEAIFFDRTGQLTERAYEIGDLLAFSEETECIGAIIGGSTDPVYFTEKRQFDSAPVTLDLFQYESAGSGAYQLAFTYPNRLNNFSNDIPDNPLQDYKSVQLADQYFSKTMDPNRNRPIVVGKPFIVIPHTRRIDVAQILEATNIYKLTQQGINSPGALFTNSPNPTGGIGLTPNSFMVSRLLRNEMVNQLGITGAQADLTWFYGDISAAFRWVQNWPITVVQAPVNSEAEFLQDIVVRWKASKRGRCAIKEPRVWQRHNFQSQASGA